MTADQAKGRVDCYKTFINETPYVFKVHVDIRLGRELMNECRIPLDFYLGPVTNRQRLPSECNRGRMPLLNGITLETTHGDYATRFSAMDDTYDAIMNANHTLIFAIESGKITMRGTNSDVG